MGVNDVGLWLMCGIAPAVGDANSAETGPFGDGVYSLDLLAGYTGFTVNEQDWTPARAQATPKKTGSAIIDYDVANVTETINVAVTGRSAAEVNLMMSRLERMAGLVREFWIGSSIEPVYIKWKAKGSPGPQYALMHNLNMADRTSGVDGLLSGALVLEIEREPYWRGIAPGANPKLWTFEADGMVPGVDFDYTDMELNDGTDHFVYEASVANKSELNDPTEFGLPTVFVSENFIDIENVPGDTDAGLFLHVEDGTGATRRFFVARKTVMPRVPSTSGNDQVHPNIMNACDAGAGVTTTMEADTGASTGMISGTAQRAKITFADTAVWGRLEFPSGSGTRAQINLWLGKYAVFARCRQINAGTVTLHLRAGFGFVTTLDDGGIKLPETPTVPAIGTSGNTTEWGLVYFGVLDIPLSDTIASQSPDGTGLKKSGSGDLALMLYAQASATTPTVYVNDLIFIPIDDGALLVDDAVGFPTDSTGYSTRGISVDFVGTGDSSAASMNAGAVEYAGRPVTLRPNVTNRLFFLSYYDDSGVLKSKASDTLEVRANIAPRWAGRRDV